MNRREAINEHSPTNKAKRPELAHWIKYHWTVVRWLPCGARLWKWADDRMERYYLERLFDQEDAVDVIQRFLDETEGVDRIYETRNHEPT